MHRHRNEGLWLSELGGYLLSPLQAEAGRKRLTRLLHSPRWHADLIDAFLWRQADQCVQELEAQATDAWLIWDESVVEKPESEKAEGLISTRSSSPASGKSNTVKLPPMETMGEGEYERFLAMVDQLAGVAAP